MQDQRSDSYLDDDGHSIADMSALRGQPQDLPQSSHSVVDELQSSEERLMVILGAMKAGLSIGMVYLVVFGLVIAFLVWAWA